MSRLDDLIRELCPDGVEFKELGDKSLFHFHYGKGNKIPKNGGAYPVYGCNGIVSSTDTYNCENVSIIGHIGSAGIVNWCSGKAFVTYNGTIADIKDKSKLDSRYLYYVLLSLNLPTYVKGSQPFLSASDFAKVRIPIPPLEVQQEIVRLLDDFTAKTSELQNKINEELEARKKQYEYYRDSLFNDKLNDLSLELCPDGVEHKKIKDVYRRIKGTPITATKMKEIANDNGDVKIFAGGKTIVYAFEKDIPNANITRVPAVLVQSRGVIDVVYCDLPFTFKNEMWAYTHENSITLKFLYYALKNNVNKFRDEASGMGSMPQISLKVTEDFSIPIPPLEVQEEIVRLLDNFTAKTTKLQDNINEELEICKKQYEFYRDKLLTFKELNESEVN